MATPAKSAPDPQKSASQDPIIGNESKAGLKVESHPDRDLLRRMILTGWAPLKIQNFLRHKYPEDESLWVSERTLYNYRTNFINLKMVLSPSEYATKIKELDVVIDTLQELYNNIEIQKRRVSLNLKIEDVNNVSLPDTRKEMELLHTMIANALQLEMKLGIRKAEPDRLEVRSMSLNELLVKYIDGVGTPVVSTHQLKRDTTS